MWHGRASQEPVRARLGWWGAWGPRENARLVVDVRLLARLWKSFGSALSWHDACRNDRRLSQGRSADRYEGDRIKSILSETMAHYPDQE